MSENRKGPNNSFYGRKHSPKNIARLKKCAINRTFDLKPGFKVEVEDLNTKTKTVYKSMREAARSLDSHMSSLLRFPAPHPKGRGREKNSLHNEESKKPFKGIYNIVILRS
jgi:hypothetical protein